MRKFIFILLFSLSVYGQVAKPTPERDLSKLEQFSDRSGLVFERQFIKVGNIRGVEIQVYRITDLVAKSTESGVRFEYSSGLAYSRDTKIAVLDADELDGLIKTIELLKASVFGSTRDAYTEVVFRSRSGFQAGAYYSDKRWTAYLKLERYDSLSQVTMRTEDFDLVLALLQKAKEQIK